MHSALAKRGIEDRISLFCTSAVSYSPIIIYGLIIFLVFNTVTLS